MRLKALSGDGYSYSESSPFENALRRAFGDHAIITIDRKGITVDGYDHD